MNTDGQHIRARHPIGPGVAALNPGLFGATAATGPADPAAPSAKKAGGLAKPRGRKAMNKTEASFAARLDAFKRRGEIVEYYREGMTLRWDDGMTYTADFFAVDPDGAVELIEVKGPWIEEDARVKFRAARDKWGLWFTFSMWQLIKGQWSKIL